MLENAHQHPANAPDKPFGGGGGGGRLCLPWEWPPNQELFFLQNEDNRWILQQPMHTSI
jgi:hypothetical protein